MEDTLDWMFDLQVVTNGSWYSSISGKGIPELIEDGTIKPIALAIDASKPVFPVTVRLGATVNLGNFESARIDIHVEAVGWVSCADENRAWAESVASEILEREVSSVKGRKRKKVATKGAPESVKAVVIGMQYGLTISTGNYESRKVDFGIFVPTRVEIVQEAFVGLSKFVGDAITSRVKKIRSNK